MMIKMLQEKAIEIQRLPLKTDFVEADRAKIKAFLGPWPRALEKAGLKGYRIGGAEVSCKHAGFIINRSNASATDVIELIAFVKATVYRKFGVMLEEEIEFI